MRSFEYTSARSVQDVITLLQEHGDGAVRPLAGGTDLLTLMKADVAAPEHLIDIKRIDDLPRGIEQADRGVTIGALTSLSEIERSSFLLNRYTAVAEAAGAAATPQLRNMATVGGNLLQRPRCWYFRSSHFNCWLKGGSDCPARDGENQLHALFGSEQCVAVHPSDLASTLVMYDAQVALRGSKGERTVPIREFFALPTEQHRTENTLGSDELVLSIHLPAADSLRSTYLKAMERKVWAFALVGVAAALKIESGRIADARLVLSGVANIPWRAEAAEQVLLGAEASEETWYRAADAALDGAQPLEQNSYKVPLAKALIRQALAALAEQ